ncbi:peptide chain release factor N(5)-glutamine methyltransferase [Desmospora activa]|uniref:Release factor glutamine methyltransferase n=1 Tax=Desmospora activa DSM 45169 TaxID=1121389 RepID=A0A2T4Z4G2_9BACL|nr:peptide chain release factor N(5)-glutamine methyltransferase [Desmospora activa]PTM56772.1 release factor glutamine methyltransferase [Desmospora activa DSM 45169]
MNEEQPTLNQLFRQFSRRLERAGVESPLFAAEFILRSVLKWDRTRFFTNIHSSMPDSLRAQAEEWLHAHCDGVPLQYLSGEQEFFGRRYRVNSSVLIPRPETEGLVEAVLTAADAFWGDRPLQVADLGCGSGAVAVTLAAERPHWQVIAVDLSPHALALARRNAEIHGVAERIQFRRGDWLQPLLQTESQIDILVSNPPYIPTDEIKGLEKGVKEYEPRLALDGGMDGLNPYRSIAKGMEQVLTSRALVAFEVGMGQGEDVVAIVKRLWRADIDTRILLDLAGKDRIVLASNQRLPESLRKKG